jgi:hypothetical protein
MMAKPITVEALAQYLIDNSLLLSALELFQELMERGETVPLVLHNFFCRDEFLSKLSKIEKSAAKRQAKLSTPLVIANEQDYQRRIKNLEYDLRQERSNAQLLRKELEAAYTSEARTREMQALESEKPTHNCNSEGELATTNFEELSLYFHVHTFLRERGMTETEGVFQTEVRRMCLFLFLFCLFCLIACLFVCLCVFFLFLFVCLFDDLLYLCIQLYILNLLFFSSV